MARYSTQLQRLGLTKEGTRGTAEAAPAVWIPTRGRATFNYDLKQYPDPAIQGIMARKQPIPGQKGGDGTIPLVLDPQTIGEFLVSLLGAPTSTQQASTAAYKHTFVRGSGIQPIAYTMFIDRSMNVLKHNLTVTKKLSLKANVNSLAEVDIDVLFKGEASGSIGSPSFAAQKYMAPHQVSVEINDVVTTDIADLAFSMDNGAKHLYTLNQSQEVDDIVAPEPLMVDASFTVFFANTTERDKFLAGTGNKLEFIFTGANIASTYYYQVAITMFNAVYTKFPYEDDGGLLAAKVTLEGMYSNSDGKDIQIDLINTKTSY